MTQEKLNKLNELNARISDVNIMLKNTKEQQCEWIEFTFGNGSNVASVCEDEAMISEIRRLLIAHHEMMLQQLTSEFEAL